MAEGKKAESQFPNTDRTGGRDTAALEPKSRKAVEWRQGLREHNMPHSLSATELRRWARQCLVDGGAAKNAGRRESMMRMRDALLALAEKQDRLDGTIAKPPYGWAELPAPGARLRAPGTRPNVQTP